MSINRCQFVWFFTHSTAVAATSLVYLVGALAGYHLLLIWITCCSCVQPKSVRFGENCSGMKNEHEKKARRSSEMKRRERECINLFPNFELLNFKQVEKFHLRNDVRSKKWIIIRYLLWNTTFPHVFPPRLLLILSFAFSFSVCFSRLDA